VQTDVLKVQLGSQATEPVGAHVGPPRLALGVGESSASSARHTPNARGFLDGSLRVEPLTTDDGVRIRELVDRYRDLPLGGTDASIVAIAERLKARRLATVDRPHFTVVRPSHVEAFELVAPPA
jgi:hypothetical protein